MNIRPCVASDAAAIERLFQEFVRYLRDIGDHATYVFGAKQYLADGFGPAPAFRGFVAEDDSGRVVGYTLFSPLYDGEYTRAFFIADLYVEQAARGAGVGRLLMNALQETAKREGRRRLMWAVHRKNTRAIHFYESLGAIADNENAFMYVDLPEARILESEA
jgi:GNAT superfamily N-acetyltransferase